MCKSLLFLTNFLFTSKVLVLKLPYFEQLVVIFYNILNNIIEEIKLLSAPWIVMNLLDELRRAINNKLTCCNSMKIQPTITTFSRTYCQFFMNA